MNSILTLFMQERYMVLFEPFFLHLNQFITTIFSGLKMYIY